MNGIIPTGIEQRLLDVAVAVAVLLAVAVLAIRFVWQPAKRLWLIQWTLIGGLTLAAGLFVPRQIVCLGLLSADHANATLGGDRTGSEPSVTEQSDYPNQSPLSNRRAGPVAEPKTLDQTSASNPSLESEPHKRATVEAPVTLLLAADVSNSWSRRFVIAYAFGILGMLVWLGLGQGTVWRLIRRAALPETGLAKYWEELQAEIFGASRRRRGPRLLISNDVSSPVAVGICRPTVLLPQWLVKSRSLDQMRPILVHELAHAARGDGTLRSLAALFHVVFFYQPLSWWLRRELRLCQEYLADAQAAGCSRSAPDYAAQLVALSNEIRWRAWRPLSAIGIVERRSELYHRIQLLVRSKRKLEMHGGRRWKLVTAVTLFIFAQSLGLLTMRAADPAPRMAVPALSVAEAPSHAKAPDVTREQAAESPPTQFEFRFQVVTAKGKPAVGATVRPWAVSLAGQGGSFSLDEKQFRSTKTDSQGMVRIAFPSVGALRDLHDRDILSVALKVDHPDHPVWSNYVAVGADENRIVLADATTVEVRAHRANEASLLRRLYPVQEAPSTDWTEADGLLTLRRVDLTSDRTSRWLRVVHVPEQGSAWFSDLLDLKAMPGNPVAIETTMKPGVRIEGRLADRVPRPSRMGEFRAWLLTLQAKGGRRRAHGPGPLRLRSARTEPLCSIPCRRTTTCKSLHCATAGYLAHPPTLN